MVPLNGARKLPALLVLTRSAGLYLDVPSGNQALVPLSFMLLPVSPTPATGSAPRETVDTASRATAVITITLARTSLKSISRLRSAPNRRNKTD